MSDVSVHQYSIAFTTDEGYRVILDYGELAHLLRVLARKVSDDRQPIADTLRVAARTVETAERIKALVTF